MSDQAPWVDDPDGYDGWLKSPAPRSRQHSRQGFDKEEPVIQSCKRKKFFERAAFRAAGCFYIAMILRVIFPRHPSENGFFCLLMLLSTVVFVASLVSAFLWNQEIYRELELLSDPSSGPDPDDPKEMPD